MNPASNLKLAIVGCGAISELFYAPALKALSQSEGIEVTALVDPNLSRLEFLGAIFPHAAKADNIAALATHPINLAIVASPPRWHAEQTIELLQLGIHVLCEKPMATSVAEAEAMVETARQTDRVLAVGLFRRFFPVSETIRDIVRNSSLGAVRQFEISEGGPFGWPAQSASFFMKAHSQGGVLADLGVHVFDLLIWWFGMPHIVSYQDDSMGGLEANCLVELKFAEGVSGTVRLSRDTRLPTRTIIECEHGWVRCPAASANELELGFLTARYSLSGKTVLPGKAGAHGFWSKPALSYHQSFVRQLENVLSAVRKQDQVLIPGEQGVLSLRLIEQCYQQRTLLPMPWMGGSEFLAARRLQKEAAA